MTGEGEWIRARVGPEGAGQGESKVGSERVTLLFLKDCTWVVGSGVSALVTDGKVVGTRKQ